MKGLLLKDWYMLWHYCKSFLLMVVVFAFSYLYFPENTFLFVYPMLLASILSMSLLSYEERCGWSVYCKSLPLSHWLIVGEKYVFTCLCTVVMLALLMPIQYSVLRRLPVFPWETFWGSVSTLALLGLVGPSVLLPLLFRFGTEKGRLAYYLVIGAGCAVSFVMRAQLPALSHPSLLLILAVLVMVVSYLLSVQFYRKREE